MKHRIQSIALRGYNVADGGCKPAEIERSKTMKKAVVFEASRTGYELGQVDRPMTVGELKEYLDNYDDDTLFFLSHDNGYTYGSISTWEAYDAHYDEDEEEWEIERY